MIKNKVLLIICLGMATQPLCSTESAEQPKNTKNNTSSWTRSPWLWGGVAFAGIVGKWIYNRYQDYKKNFSQPEEKKENNPYDFIYKKYAFYLKNKLDDKNFFEKTTQEKSIKNKRTNVLTQKNIPTPLEAKLLDLEEKNLKNTYKNTLNKVIDIIKEQALYEKIRSIISANDQEKEKLLQDYVQEFLKTKDIIYVTSEVKENSDLTYLCNCLLLYYEPTQTLRKIEEEGKNLRYIETVKGPMRLPLSAKQN